MGVANRIKLMQRIDNLMRLAGPLNLGRNRYLKLLYYRFISSPAVVNGYFIYLQPYDKDAIFTRKLLKGKLHEEFESECFKSLIKPGMTVLDVGANVGYYTLSFASSSRHGWAAGSDGRDLALGRFGWPLLRHCCSPATQGQRKARKKPGMDEGQEGSSNQNVVVCKVFWKIPKIQIHRTGLLSGIRRMSCANSQR